MIMWVSVWPDGNIIGCIVSNETTELSTLPPIRRVAAIRYRVEMDLRITSCLYYLRVYPQPIYAFPGVMMNLEPI